jgi:phosphotransferase system HPr (HPr) family protein
MAENKIVVTHEVGLHARPASVFVQTANKFESEITVQNLTEGGDEVDAKSIIMVLTLGVVKGHEILIRAEGTDAEQAVQSLTELVQSNFGEAQAA